ncbi:proton-conducting transporter membrane subunit [Novosphingobium sp.]|uniref:proton-conducting transporter transmembrane domain-containing protein n=1 Tax=Novosphingobium sp. TaxID=1874826 RepID=UPI0026172D7A|nr:proton-conducting transporter membrane subunit [Novosphingobium sp.]
MNQNSMSASLGSGVRTAAPAPAQSLPLSSADLPVVALGGLLALTVAYGHAAATAAGIALAGLSLLVTLIVLVFARRQLRADPRAASFARMATGLAIATVLMGIAADVLLLAAAWIVSGRLMAGLIGHVGEWAEARSAARRASISFAVGDLALVGAAILLAIGAGSTEISAITAAVPTMANGFTIPAAFLLVIAALARCALPPFSSWLMRSLAAPTPVSALMHAGFVNAGGFLLVRFAPVLETATSARFTLFIIGLAAALFGSAIMLVRSDVKGSLAASTVAQMGFMLLTVALGAYAAALWHMVAHGMFKAWLFLGSSGTISTASPAAKGLPKPWPAAIALATLASALVFNLTGEGTALLPVGLACAALLSALAIGLRAIPRSPLGLMVAAAPLLLIALNAAALTMMSALQVNAAQPLIPDYAQFGLLSVLLAGWVVQQRIASGEAALPPALFARLMHVANPTA